MIFDEQTVGHEGGRVAGLADNFGTSRGQTLAGTNIERHALPAPRINFQLQGGEGFGLRVLGYSIFVAVATELTPHQILFFYWGMAFNTFTFSSRIDSLSV